MVCKERRRGEKGRRIERQRESLKERKREDEMEGSKETEIGKRKQTNKQTKKRTYKQTSKKTNKEAKKQTKNEAKKQTNKQTEKKYSKRRVWDYQSFTLFLFSPLHTLFDLTLLTSRFTALLYSTLLYSTLHDSTLLYFFSILFCSVVLLAPLFFPFLSLSSLIFTLILQSGCNLIPYPSISFLISPLLPPFLVFSLLISSCKRISFSFLFFSHLFSSSSCYLIFSFRLFSIFSLLFSLLISFPSLPLWDPFQVDYALSMICNRKEGILPYVLHVLISDVDIIIFFLGSANS